MVAYNALRSYSRIYAQYARFTLYASPCTSLLYVSCCPLACALSRARERKRVVSLTLRALFSFHPLCIRSLVPFIFFIWLVSSLAKRAHYIHSFFSFYYEMNEGYVIIPRGMRYLLLRSSSLFIHYIIMQFSNRRKSYSICCKNFDSFLCRVYAMGLRNFKVNASDSYYKRKNNVYT